MKKLLIIFLLLVSLSHAEKPFLSITGTAGDVWHFTGSALLTLGIQRTAEIEWGYAAGYSFAAGFLWEVGDSIFHKGIFDPAGFDPDDILRNVLGIAISYPLRYDFRVGVQKDKITLSYRW